jgi:hypothetical protein
VPVYGCWKCAKLGSYLISLEILKNSFNCTAANPIGIASTINTTRMLGLPTHTLGAYSPRLPRCCLSRGLSLYVLVRVVTRSSYTAVHENVLFRFFWALAFHCHYEVKGGAPSLSRPLPGGEHKAPCASKGRS